MGERHAHRLRHRRGGGGGATRRPPDEPPPHGPRGRALVRRPLAEHVLLQLALRRVPGLQRPRRAEGDRPRPRRPEPEEDDRARAASAPLGTPRDIWVFCQLNAVAEAYGFDFETPLKDSRRAADGRCSSKARATSSSTSSTRTRGGEVKYQHRFGGVYQHIEHTHDEHELGDAAAVGRGVHARPPVPDVRRRAAQAGVAELPHRQHEDVRGRPEHRRPRADGPPRAPHVVRRPGAGGPAGA